MYQEVVKAKIFAIVYGPSTGTILKHPFTGDWADYDFLLDGICLEDNVEGEYPATEGLYILDIEFTIDEDPPTMWEPGDVDVSAKLVGYQPVPMPEEANLVAVYSPVRGTAEASYEPEKN